MMDTDLEMKLSASVLLVVGTVEKVVVVVWV